MLCSIPTQEGMLEPLCHYRLNHPDVIYPYTPQNIAWMTLYICLLAQMSFGCPAMEAQQSSDPGRWIPRASRPLLFHSAPCNLLRTPWPHVARSGSLSVQAVKGSHHDVDSRVQPPDQVQVAQPLFAQIMKCCHDSSVFLYQKL